MPVKVQVVGFESVILGLRQDAVKFRRAERRLLRKAGRVLVEEARRQIPAAGIVPRTGLLERGMRSVIYQAGPDSFKLQVKPRKINLGNWISAGKNSRGKSHAAQQKRVDSPFYWYFLEYGTGQFFQAPAGRSSGAIRSALFRMKYRKVKPGGTGRGRSQRAREFMLAAAQAKQTEVVEIVGSAYDVFF